MSQDYPVERFALVNNFSLKGVDYQRFAPRGGAPTQLYNIQQLKSN